MKTFKNYINEADTLRKDQFIAELNKDLELEYNACVQYVQHQAAITTAEFQAMQEELAKHAKEELDHALTISTQIDYLGGTPSVAMPPPKVSEDNKEMLKQDLDGENDAIRRYTERIEQAEKLGLSHVAQVIRDVLVKEQEHAIDLETALGIKHGTSETQAGAGE